MTSPAASDALERTIRELSDRLVDAQRPIRILDAIKWDAGVEAAFFADGCRTEPRVDADWYAARPLGFDPARKQSELAELARDVERRLGRSDPVAGILVRMCEEYATVVRMLEARGTPEFTRLSRSLYGSANDALHAGDPTLAELGVLMSEALANLGAGGFASNEEKRFTGEEAVAILQERLDAAFPDPDHRVRVIPSDGIVADAAAGARHLKIRRDARFSEREIRALEIHEGWVHLGTTLNGLSQPVCTFLSKGPPSSTVTQEGLAILLEILSFSSHPVRLRKLTNRIRSVHMAEEGASFLDVFRFLGGEGLGEREAYANAVRVFRGSTPRGGPFTKDLSYSKGFVLIYNFLRLAVRRGLLDRIPLLFCGKTTLEDLRTLAGLVEAELVRPPIYLPPQIRDLGTLAAWLCYANFLGRIDLARIEQDYAGYCEPLVSGRGARARP
jgi:uncharacterized protein (TIGR02421 family)